MVDLVKKLQTDISAAVKSLYQLEIPSSEIFIEHPENMEWGDYATNIPLKLAKVLKQGPMEIAKNLHYELRSMETLVNKNHSMPQIFTDISIASPGFINFKLSTEWLIYLLTEIVEQKNNYGSVNLGGGKRVSLEHSNVNPNKAAHVGHLRNACIGQFIERTYEFLGYDVNVQYYDNDLGVQVTTSLMGMEKIKELSPAAYEKYDHYAWDVYSRMEAQISADAELRKERQDLMSQLEKADSDVSIKQEKLAQRILEEQLKTFHDLSFDYDVIVRERDIVSLKFWDRAFALMKGNPSFYLATTGPSSGCWLVRMSDGHINSQEGTDLVEEDKIIVRSNGVPTYTGKDIAYHMWKFGLLGGDFFYNHFDAASQQKPLYITSYNNNHSSQDITFSNAALVINVIDMKQTYAMEAVKVALEHLNYKEQAKNMIHVNYGFVYLSPLTAQHLGMDVSEGKDRYEMSGRKGWGIKIDDFITSIENKLISDFGNFENIKSVRNGAIKFEMLKYNTFQDITFDLSTALNQKGFTGPYIQYTYARTCALLDKAGDSYDAGLSSYLAKNAHDFTSSEIDILRHIYKFSETVLESATTYSSNTLCTFLFSLCQKFNQFYAETPILKEVDSEKRYLRILITQSVQQVIHNGLFLLGIESPTRM